MRHAMARSAAAVLCGLIAFLGGVFDDGGVADGSAQFCESGLCGYFEQEQCAVWATVDAQCACEKCGPMCERPSCKAVCDEREILLCACLDNSLCDPSHPGPDCPCTCQCYAPVKAMDLILQALRAPLPIRP